MKILHKQNGFTLVELMIATAVFSFILLIATAGIIRIGQMYYKGVTESKTQETVRAVSDELSRAVQFANGIKQNGYLADQFCLGEYRYTVYPNTPYSPANANTGLKVEKLTTGSGCGCPDASCVAESRQLLGTNMRILKFQLENIESSEKAWRINIRLAYGDNDLLTHYNNPSDYSLVTGDPTTATCKSGISGSSFCAIAQVDTIVKKRLN